MHRKNILIYVQQDATLHSLFYLENALHVSVGTTNHHQERKQLYLQHLVFVRPLLLPTAIAAGSSNGVTNTRCCRYGCMSSWWWVEVPPETCRAVSGYNKLCNGASCRTLLKQKRHKLLSNGIHPVSSRQTVQGFGYSNFTTKNITARYWFWLTAEVWINNLLSRPTHTQYTHTHTHTYIYVCVCVCVSVCVI